MFSTVISGAIHGITSYLMHVEVDAADGLPAFNMVGLPSAEVREAGERVKVALKNSGIRIPPMHITVNLSPADIRKEGVAVDLPVALGILLSMGEIAENALLDTMVIGELGLDGEVKGVKGVLPIVQEAQRKGCKTCILPLVNAREGAVVQNIRIIGVKSLQEAITFLQANSREQDQMIAPTKVSISDIFSEAVQEYTLDFAEVNGQAAAKRAVEIAAAGFHHVLMMGPPGSGKSMIAKRIPTILPPLALSESLEVSAIYSVAGLLKADEALITRRPFMNPHHSITDTALVGGGRIPQPGIISLAHRGVLFLDEMAEFHRPTLDLMRQPLEDRSVHIARNGGTFSYPADFMLVGALNPCPCGYYPDRNRCRCTPREIAKYLGHISGPILDRIDLCVEVPGIAVEELGITQARNESSSLISMRVRQAREKQRIRFQGTGLRFNSDMGPQDIQKYCRLGIREKRMLEQIFHSMNLSARAYHRIIKVARTIADLDGAAQISEMHLTEASCYRLADTQYGKENMRNAGEIV